MPVMMMSVFLRQCSWTAAATAAPPINTAARRRAPALAASDTGRTCNDPPLRSWCALARESARVVPLLPDIKPRVLSLSLSLSHGRSRPPATHTHTHRPAAATLRLSAPQQPATDERAAVGCSGFSRCFRLCAPPLPCSERVQRSHGGRPAQQRGGLCQQQRQQQQQRPGAVGLCRCSRLRLAALQLLRATARVRGASGALAADAGD